MAHQSSTDLLLFFCDDAETGVDGKLSARAIYNELYAAGFPARQDKLVLAGIVEWDRSVDGEQAFEVRILDPDEKAIFSIEGATQVDARSPDRAPAKTHLIFPLENLVFMKAGSYSVTFKTGGTELRGPLLHVLKSGNKD